MMPKKMVACVLFLFATGLSSFAQAKKESTTVNINIERDTVINYKKPQTSVTEGSVMVEGKRINYNAVAGTLVLKNNLDTPTISMSYVAYFKNDEKDNA